MVMENCLKINNMNWYKISQSWYTVEVAKTTKDSKILTDILRKGKNDFVSCSVARNPNCPPEALTEILRRGEDDLISECAAQNPNTPPEILVEVLRRGKNDFVSCSVARNPNTPPKALAEVLRRGNNDLVSYYAASNPNTPSEALAEVLRRGKNDNVSCSAARNPNAPPKALIDWMRATGKIGKEDPKKHIIEYDNKEEEIDEDLEKLRKLISNNKNWYKIAQEKDISLLTKEELLQYEFPNSGSGHSLTPKRIFEMKKNRENETLADLASYPDQWRFYEVLGKGWEGHFGQEVVPSLHLIDKIKNGQEITVYRASKEGGILPGAYVTESKEYAVFHGDTVLGGDYRIYQINVYPDELMVYGDPHEFIYMPRNIDVAHERLNKNAQLNGEWWIINGSALYADGNVGMMNHEAYVIDHIKRKYAYDEFDKGEYIDWDKFKLELAREKLAEEYGSDLAENLIEKKDPMIKDIYLKKLKEMGMTDEEYALAEGIGDAREYGMKELGWKRVKSNNIQTETLTHQDLKEIADGLWNAYDEQCENQKFNIEVNANSEIYSDVPYVLIADGSPTQLRTFSIKYAQVSSSNIYCENDVIQKREDLAPSMLRKKKKRKQPKETKEKMQDPFPRIMPYAQTRSWYKKAQQYGFDDRDTEGFENVLYQIDSERINLLQEYYKKKKQKMENLMMNWQVIPFDRLKKIWQDYVKYGVVRDKQGLDNIIEQILKNLIRLQAATDLAGHSQFDTKTWAKEIGLRHPHNKNINFYYKFLETPYGTPISDFGLSKLWKIAEQFFNPNSYEQKLLLVDQFLNIIHPRGDLAALFIEGGSESLSELSE